MSEMFTPETLQARKKNMEDALEFHSEHFSKKARGKVLSAINQIESLLRTQSPKGLNDVCVEKGQFNFLTQMFAMCQSKGRYYYRPRFYGF